MNALVEMSKYGHEKVLFINNEEAGLKAVNIRYYKSLKSRAFLWGRKRTSEVCRLNIIAMSFREHAS